MVVLPANPGAGVNVTCPSDVTSHLPSSVSTVVAGWPVDGLINVTLVTSSGTFGSPSSSLVRMSIVMGVL